MVRIARKSDGRRIYTAEFKREHMGRVLRGELTIGELSRKLGIVRGVLQRWKRLMAQEVEVAGAPGMGATPITGLRAAQYIRELQLLVGKQAVELEVLRAEFAALKRVRRLPGVARR